MKIGFRRKKMSSLSIPAVTSIDLDRFEGTWFELARIPIPVARDWVGTSDTYSRDGRGGWKVSYRGFKGSTSGPAKKLGQKLRIPDPARPGEMEVSFIPLLWMKYRIVYMSADSRFMLVTSSSMRYLWIMGTERNPPDKTYKNLVWRAKDFGFDTAKLQRIDQSGLRN